MKKVILLFLSLIGLGIFSVYAQENNYGQVSGNFQSYGQYYVNDSAINAFAPDEKFLLNSWANIAYTQGKFTAGFRFEGYMNSLLGYPNEAGLNDGVGIPIMWAMFSDENLEVTVGNFYEQFGNGLVFRSYEEKMLGVDNAMNGLRVKYTITPGIYLKGMIGKQRRYWDYGPGLVRGIDGEIQFNEVISSFENSDLRLTAGGSFVSKFQEEENPTYNLPQNVGAGAGRISIMYKGFALNSEYAYKINDPSGDNGYIYKPGQAFLVNATYSTKGFGAILGTKWVDNMSFRSDRNANLTDLNINLLPEITRNHLYTLSATYPYASQPNGEFGLQATIYYKIPKKTLIGGKYGTTISLNYSRVHGIEKYAINDSTPIDAKGTLGYATDFFSIGEEMYFEDINVEISRKWNKKIYTNVSYLRQFFNYNIIRGVQGEENVVANIGIIDLTYKIKRGIAIRTEFQGLFTEQDDGSWGLGLVELTIPHWFFNISDNWNYGNSDPTERNHYMNFSFGYIKGGSRIQLIVGRKREGYMCSGGVCRFEPASSGVSLSISSTF